MIPDLVPFTWEKPTGDDGSWRVSHDGRFPVFEVLKMETAPPLPVEFFARELLEYDATDPDSVVSLMSEWGPLVHPLRLQISEVSRNPFAVFGCEDIAFWLEETNASGGGVGVREALGALDDLQSMARAALNLAQCERFGDLDDDNLSWLRQIDDSRCPPEVLHLGGHRLAFCEYGTDGMKLTRAICNQMFSFIMDAAPVRSCANEKCGRLFKRKRGRASYVGHGDSLYCCTRCETAQRQRDYRRRKKSEKAT